MRQFYSFIMFAGRVMNSCCWFLIIVSRIGCLQSVCFKALRNSKRLFIVNPLIPSITSLVYRYLLSICLFVISILFKGKVILLYSYIQ